MVVAIDDEMCAGAGQLAQFRIGPVGRERGEHGLQRVGRRVVLDDALGLQLPGRLAVVELGVPRHLPLPLGGEGDGVLHDLRTLDHGLRLAGRRHPRHGGLNRLLRPRVLRRLGGLCHRTARRRTAQHQNGAGAQRQHPRAPVVPHTPWSHGPKPVRKGSGSGHPQPPRRLRMRGPAALGAVALAGKYRGRMIDRPDVRGARFRNGGHTQEATISEFIQPQSEQELTDVIAAASRRGHRVKAVGAGHSWSDAACTDGTLVGLDNMRGIIRSAPDRVWPPWKPECGSVSSTRHWHGLGGRYQFRINLGAERRRSHGHRHAWQRAATGQHRKQHRIVPHRARRRIGPGGERGFRS